MVHVRTVIGNVILRDGDLTLSAGEYLPDVLSLYVKQRSEMVDCAAYETHIASLD